VIEVNPRATVAYAGLSARLGRNLAADVLAAHGLQVAPRARDSASGSAAGAKLSAFGAES
jgi:predicted ATP-grasp superfamily ATP-dependent carboligase